MDPPHFQMWTLNHSTFTNVDLPHLHILNFCTLHISKFANLDPPHLHTDLCGHSTSPHLRMWTLHISTFTNVDPPHLQICKCGPSISLHLRMWTPHIYKCGPSTSSRSVRVAERLALPTSDHGVSGSNPAGGKILPEPKQRFTEQSLSCSPFHRLRMTEILLKGT